MLVLTLSKQRNGKPARVVEYIVVSLVSWKFALLRRTERRNFIQVAATFICFVVLIIKVRPHWPSVFQGYLPSHALVQHGAIYTCTDDLFSGRNVG